jgi:glycerol-1-phosphate dehydrogenase [NAD(P)+]
VQASFGKTCRESFLFGPDIYAEYPLVERLQARLAAAPGIAVAVGSGTINDLTKLASHRLGRPYMVVATAASMDGYTAFGASITYKGSKQTFDCPAPAGVLADLDVIARAPAGMNPSGYADLLAKNVAGADWILAEAAGVEPVDTPVWSIVHQRLREWVGAPGAVARNQPEALHNLVYGLMMTGLAMQAHRTSRPASGAEHQFSHLWDMQHHVYNGKAPSHGFKVGIGLLASLAAYECLLGMDVSNLDVDRAAAERPSLEGREARIAELFGPGELADKALEETRAKYVPADAVRGRLMRFRERWPETRERLVRHLIPFDQARAMLCEAGCPYEPQQIGISLERLERSYRQACYIRRRYTVLDLGQESRLAPAMLARMFGPGGRWQRP